jgi:hypothetical protein
LHIWIQHPLRISHLIMNPAAWVALIVPFLPIVLADCAVTASRPVSFCAK